MKYKPYPKYKDSGVEWLGEIPDEWRTKRIKHTTYVKGRIGWQGLKSDEFIDDGPYLVTGTDFNKGLIDWDSCYHVSFERYNEDHYIQLKENDLLITKDGTIGKTAIVKDQPDKASLNSGIFVTRPTSNDYITSFLYWVLNSIVFSDFIDFTKTGTTISHLYQNVFVDFTFPIPTLIEQTKISTFLDHETARIDTLIQKKERQIELLKEKRAALISHAVTKGLDPNVKMKDLGVEWLGEIPEHWQILPLRRLIKRIRNGVTLKQIEPSDYTVQVTRIETISQGVVDLSKTGHVEWVPLLLNYELQKGDLLFSHINSISMIGNCALYDLDVPLYHGMNLLCLRPNSIVSPRWFWYLISSEGVRWSFGSLAKPAINQASLTTMEIKSFRLVLPPPNEQYTIIKHIDNETARIDAMIEKVQQSIDLLKEYRTALISAAVTGKIDIREAV